MVPIFSDGEDAEAGTAAADDTADKPVVKKKKSGRKAKEEAILEYLKEKTKAKDKELAIREKEIELEKAKLELEKQRFELEAKEKEQRSALEAKERTVFIQVVKEKILNK